MEQRWQSIYRILCTTTGLLWPLFFFLLFLHPAYVLSLHFPILPPPIYPCIDKYSSHHLWLIFSKPSAANCYILSSSEDAGTSTLYTPKEISLQQQNYTRIQNKHARPSVQMHAGAHTRILILAYTDRHTRTNRCSYKACKFHYTSKTLPLKKDLG